MNSLKTSRFWKILLGVGTLLAVPSFFQTWQKIETLGINLWRSQWLFLVLGYFANLFVFLGMLFFDFSDKFPRFSVKTKFLKAVIFFFFVLGNFLVPFLVFRDVRNFLPRGVVLLWSVLWLGILGAWLLSFVMDLSFPVLLAISLLSQGVASRLVSLFSAVSRYPFSIGWSESSRYYYASLFFSEKIYHQRTPLSILHPTRYLLQSFPFLFDNSTLWMSRAWQSFLWVALTGGAAFALAWRFRGQVSRWKRVALGLWFFLYLFQGAVYYHLLVCVILVLLGAHPKRPWRTFLILLVASFWAGISRLNWYPVPAMLVILLYFLEEPFAVYKNSWRYFAKPALWAVAGVGTALLSQFWYVFWSGNAENVKAFGSSFSSPLLWERLLPNATYKPGVLLAVLFVSLPMLGLIFSALRGRRKSWHPLRLAGIGAMILVLFAGGLVVSVKIGGGGDLHNMDAYLVLLGVLTAYLVFDGKIVSESSKIFSSSPLPWIWLALAVIIPVSYAALSLHPRFVYDAEQSQEDAKRISQLVSEANARGDEVLFITQRHFLTFHMVEGVDLVPENEVVTLMEMAMSGNDVYLNHFYEDLHRHRFGLIIAPPQFLIIKSSDEPFAAENNVWVYRVSRYLLCEYEPSETFKEEGVAVFVPRTSKVSCPLDVTIQE